MQISLTMLNVTLMSKMFQSITKLLALVLYNTTSLQQMVTYFISLPFGTIIHQLLFGSLVIKLILNFVLVQMSWIVTELQCISNKNLTCLVDMNPINHPKSNLPIITNTTCIKKILMWLGHTSSLLLSLSITIQFLLIIGMLKLMILNVSLAVTPRCNNSVNLLKTM